MGFMLELPLFKLSILFDCRGLEEASRLERSREGILTLEEDIEGKTEMEDKLLASMMVL